MCLVKDISKIDAFNLTLETIGYEAAGEWGISGRRLFRKGGENRTHHLHVYQSDHPEIERHLLVRDYLRTYPKEATMYSRLKEKLAQEYNDTRFIVKRKSHLFRNWRNAPFFGQKKTSIITEYCE